MSVLVDTGVIVAYLHRRDTMHDVAEDLLPPLLDGARGPPSVTDDIVDEVVTFFVAKGATRAQLDRTIAFMLGDGEAPGAFVLHRVGPDHFAEALHLVRRYREHGVSFTDCTSLAVMASAGIPVIASFDKGFDGLVERLGGDAD